VKRIKERGTLKELLDRGIRLGEPIVDFGGEIEEEELRKPKEQVVGKKKEEEEEEEEE